MKGSGAKLKNLRKEAGYTQLQLAEKIGISRETVVAIENEHPNTIDSLEFRVARKWWEVCRARARNNTRNDFKALVTKFFNI